MSWFCHPDLLPLPSQEKCQGLPTRPGARVAKASRGVLQAWRGAGLQQPWPPHSRSNTEDHDAPINLNQKQHVLWNRGEWPVAWLSCGHLNHQIPLPTAQVMHRMWNSQWRSSENTRPNRLPLDLVTASRYSRSQEVNRCSTHTRSRGWDLSLILLSVGH